MSEWLPVPSTSCRMPVVEEERAARSHPPRPSMASLRACRWPSTTALVLRLLRSDRQLAVKLTALNIHCSNIVTHGTLVRVRSCQQQKHSSHQLTYLVSHLSVVSQARLNQTSIVLEQGVACKTSSPKCCLSRLIIL